MFRTLVSFDFMALPAVGCGEAVIIDSGQRLASAGGKIPERCGGLAATISVPDLSPAEGDGGWDRSRRRAAGEGTSPGRVKTRLCHPVPDEAAASAPASSRHGGGIGSLRGVRRFLFLDPPESSQGRRHPFTGFERLPQRGRDWGADAPRGIPLLPRGARRVVLVGRTARPHAGACARRSGNSVGAGAVSVLPRTGVLPPRLTFPTPACSKGFLEHGGGTPGDGRALPGCRNALLLPPTGARRGHLRDLLASGSGSHRARHPAVPGPAIASLRIWRRRQPVPCPAGMNFRSSPRSTISPRKVTTVTSFALDSKEPPPPHQRPLPTVGDFGRPGGAPSCRPRSGVPRSLGSTGGTGRDILPRFVSLPSTKGSPPLLFLHLDEEGAVRVTFTLSPTRVRRRPRGRVRREGPDPRPSATSRARPVPPEAGTARAGRGAPDVHRAALRTVAVALFRKTGRMQYGHTETSAGIGLVQCGHRMGAVPGYGAGVSVMGLRSLSFPRQAGDRAERYSTRRRTGTPDGPGRIPASPSPPTPSRRCPGGPRGIPANSLRKYPP